MVSASYSPPDVQNDLLRDFVGCSFLLLLVNGALLALCRRWIGKCKWARPQNECTQLVTRTIETPILSLRAGRFFFGVTNTCTTRGAQLAFGKNHIVSPQTLRGRAKTQPPRAGCPRDVRYELRSKSGYHLKNIAWGLISIPKLRLDILTEREGTECLTCILWMCSLIFYSILF